MPVPSVTLGTTAAPQEGFEFGGNWQRFLRSLDEERILEAEVSLRCMLSIEDLNRQMFLDVGCESGLFSLAARRVGARVFSFDADHTQRPQGAEVQ